MTIRTSCCVAFFTLSLGIAPAGSAQSLDGTFSWASIAPSSAIAQKQLDTVANPLLDEGSGDRDVLDRGKRMKLAEQVDLHISTFGRISAPRGLGTIEGALDDLTLVPNEPRRSHRAWVTSLPQEEIDRLIDELATIVDERQARRDAGEPSVAPDLRDDPNYRSAIAQLRQLKSLQEELDRQAEANRPLMEDLPASSEADRERDAEAIRRVFTFGAVSNGPAE